MKRRLLIFALLVVALIAVFATAASAKEWTYKDEAGKTYLTLTIDDSSKIITTYEGRFPMWDEKGQPLTWYVIATDDTNGIKTVKGFVSTDPLYTNHGNNYFRFVKSENFTVEGYPAPTRENVVSMNMPNDKGITAFSNYSSVNFHAGITYTPDAFELLFLRCPNTLTNTDRLVQASKVLEVEFDKESVFTELSHLSFHEAKSLRKVNIPASVEVIKSISDNHGRAFNYCVSLETITFDEGSNLKLIQGGAFNGCDSLKEVQLPASMTTIDNNALSYCDGIEIVRFPETFTHFVNTNGSGAIRNDHHSFTYNSDSIKEYYIPASFYATAPDTVYQVSYAFYGSNRNVKIFYCGTEAQLAIAMENFKTATSKYYDNNGNFTGATPVSYETYAAAIALDPTAYSDKDYIIYGYNACDAFHGGVHNYQGTGDCKDGLVCNSCKLTIAGAAEHTYYETLVYASFASNGVYNYGCSNEGCTKYDIVDRTEAPIFVAKEYSNGDNGIAGGYTVNITAYNNYVDVTGKTITFGVLMLNPKYLDGKDSFFNGTNVSIDGTKGYVKVDMTNLSYKDFTYSITGFGADAKDVDLVVCAFAYVEGEDVEFIQDQTTKCASKKVTKNDATLYTVTYNTVEARPGNAIADLGEYTVREKDEE